VADYKNHTFEAKHMLLRAVLNMYFFTLLLGSVSDLQLTSGPSGSGSPRLGAAGKMEMQRAVSLASIGSFILGSFSFMTAIFSFQVDQEQVGHLHIIKGSSGSTSSQLKLFPQH